MFFSKKGLLGTSQGTLFRRAKVHGDALLYVAEGVGAIIDSGSVERIHRVARLETEFEYTCVFETWNILVLWYLRDGRRGFFPA